MAKSTVVQKNYAFEFYRFLFACVIFIMHMEDYRNYDPPYGMFSDGSLGAEFFFILSGFFLMEKAGRNKRDICIGGGAEEIETAQYFLSRYRRLMSHYWASIGVHMSVCSLLYEGFQWKDSLVTGFPEIFAVQTFWSAGNINSVLWFVSALLWASALAYYLLLKNKKFFIYVAFPFGVLVFMGWTYRTNGCIAIFNNDKIFMGTFWRAFFEIALGCVICQIYLVASQYNWNSFILTAIEVGLLSVILMVMWGSRPDYKDFVMVFVIGALILVTALNQGYLTRLLNNKIFAGCGAVSYALYVNHRAVQLIAFQFPGHPFWLVTGLSLAVAIIYSALVTVCFNWCEKYLRRWKSGKRCVPIG